MRVLLAKPMHERHRNADAIFLRRFEEVRGELGELDVPDERDRLLIGAYFSQEYAFESAALFNPSIHPHPGEERTPDGKLRFVLALRGVGEGHISSVTLRSGAWDGDREVVIDQPSAQGVPPRIERDDGEWVRLQCPDSQDLSETVIFPVLPSQSAGIEDLRLVNFTDDDGARSVIGIYTANSGGDTRSEMLRAVDLQNFEMIALRGAMAAYKGMALFPRRIDGRFAMLGRQDSESIWLLRSDDLTCWEEGEVIMEPRYPWEFVQIGNCGAPIELDEGWLVFTHGVGLVRGYCIGACLLDKANPARVLARTRSPLIFPSSEQRGGYVPNVTYSCGALVYDRRVLLPYAIGDEYTAFAVGGVDDLLHSMAPA